MLLLLATKYNGGVHQVLKLCVTDEWITTYIIRVTTFDGVNLVTYGYASLLDAIHDFAAMGD